MAGLESARTIAAGGVTLPGMMRLGGPARTRVRRLGGPVLVLLLTLLVLVVLIVFPTGALLVNGVWDNGHPTLAHFARVLSGRLYLEAISNSLQLGAYVAVASVIIGVPLAWLVNRTDLPAKRLVHIGTSLSYVSPPFLVAIAYVSLLSPNAGLLNVLVRDVLHMPWLAANVFSMPGLVLVTAIHTFPFVYLLASAAFESVDPSYEEAAQMLGAGRIRTALQVTIPLVAPAVLSGVLLSFVNAISLFGSQAVVGLPGHIVTLPTRIYSLFDFPPEYGPASALSLIMVAITLAALGLQRAYLARRSYVTVGGKGARGKLIRLGAARWPLFGFCVLTFVISTVMPVLTLVAVSVSKSWGLAFWQNLTWDNYSFVLFEYDVTSKAIVNSLGLAAIAATLVGGLGLLIGWIDLRSSVWGKRVLDYLALVPLGLPGIVMGVALIQFWLAMPVALYGTYAILLLAYVAHYIPIGARSANSSLRQVDPSLEECARILGADWSRTLREVTIPLIRPGLLSGWILVFVPAVQELSASLLLFSTKTITMSVAIYNLYETGYTEPVAAMAIINFLIIGVAVGLATLLGRRRGMATAEA